MEEKLEITYSEESMMMWMRYEVNPIAYRDSISLSKVLRCSQDDIVKAYWEMEAQVVNGREQLIYCDMVNLEGYETLGRTFMYNMCDALTLAICYKFGHPGAADRVFRPLSGRRHATGFNAKCLKQAGEDSTGRLWKLV
jgi:hypothetical protein